MPHTYSYRDNATQLSCWFSVHCPFSSLLFELDVKRGFRLSALLRSFRVHVSPSACERGCFSAVDRFTICSLPSTQGPSHLTHANLSTIYPSDLFGFKRPF
ncbi:hypothetical protein CSKR_200901 [Clonorchis sinensis]|uniref:Uncharacterized protein n=1 Tax=Clonorchis sinensis TaxID=79923 RepID=A0A8T1MJV8_CLOSI|nr:hypothetical protein CSKR_200901 [Clonorchis sinensis]